MIDSCHTLIILFFFFVLNQIENQGDVIQGDSFACDNLLVFTEHFKEQLFAAISVSYTHLDVYKRQGSYGVQEWIGFVGVESISGSYFNVMGLPIQKLYRELKQL